MAYSSGNGVDTVMCLAKNCQAFGIDLSNRADALAEAAVRSLILGTTAPRLQEAPSFRS